MEEVAEAINYQMKNFDGSGYLSSPHREDDIPLISRILRVAGDFESLVSTPMPEITSNSSASAGMIVISGYPSSRSHLLIVLLETFSRSATSCWVIPLAFLKAAIKPPIVFDP